MKFLKSYWLIIVLVSVVAVVLTWQLNALPLTAYDEVIYARVTHDTLHSSSILSLQQFGHPWLEKPPLYFWLAMFSTSLVGDHEWAYRLPSVLSALAVALLLFLIANQLGLNRRWSVLSALILTTIPYWFIVMRQVRVDGLLIAFFLLALYWLIRSWQQPKYALGIAPAIALAIMTKSVAAISILPILLAFSGAYRQWQWLRSRWFYFGGALALLIAVPWHWYEASVYGQTFWTTYLGFNVLQRATQGFGLQATHWYDYFVTLGKLAQPWYTLWILSLIIGLVSWRQWSSSNASKKLWLASSLSALGIIILYSLFKTHIPTYILPAYPFMALSLVCVLKMAHDIYLQKLVAAKRWLLIGGAVVLAIALIISYQVGRSIMPGLHFAFDAELKSIGQTVNVLRQPKDRFYQLAWPVGDTLSYYADMPIATVNLPPTGQTVNVEGPLYLFLQTEFMPLFFDDQGKIAPEYADMRLKYRSDHFVLLYSEKSIEIRN